MRNIVLNILRIIKSVGFGKILKMFISLFSKFFYDIFHFGLRIAHYNFRGEFANSNLLPGKLNTLIKNKNKQLNVDFLMKKYANLIEEYKNKKIEVGENCKKVWVLWWQGLDQAPEIVKICVNSIKKNNCGYEIVLLDKDNYQDYIRLPEFILKKFKKNKISVTHLSDIIRMALLKEYGGIRCDATMFINSDVFKRFNNLDLNLFASYFQGGKPNRLFNFCYDFFIQYHKDFEQLINYFLIDYAVIICSTSYEDCNFEKNYMHNEKIYSLTKEFNKVYDKTKRDELFKAPFFKLTWKLKFRAEINGKKTNYGHFLEKYSK